MKNAKSKLDSKRKRQRDSEKVVDHEPQADESDANHEMQFEVKPKSGHVKRSKHSCKLSENGTFNEPNKASAGTKIKMKKAKKGMKHERKSFHVDVARSTQEQPAHFDDEKADEISFVDEDCTRGMKIEGKPKSGHAKRSKQSCKLSESGTFDEPKEASDGTKMRTKKAKKEMKCNKKDFNIVKEMTVEETPVQADEVKVDGISLVDEACSKEMKKKKKKGMKHRRKDFHVNVARTIGEPAAQVDEDKVDEILSVDEDCSRGMKKWLIKYRESRQDLKVLQQKIDDFITAHEEQLERERKEREDRAAEGGWTVVVHHKGRKKTTDTETGVTVGSVSQAAVVDSMSKKKTKEAPIHFYRFQNREAKRNEVMMLQSKFEQDKKRIQQLRAARKFRPY